MMRSFGINFEMSNPDELSYLTRDALKDILLEKITDAYNKRKEEIGAELFAHIERMVLLQMIDVAWKENLYELDQLKKGIGYRAYAQKDPKIEYQKESFILFDGMMKRIREATIEYVFKVQVNVTARPIPTKQTENSDPTTVSNAQQQNNRAVQQKQISASDIKKIGRNDPCPCGSGKKYKKCCGKNI
jgi:preprotein translocase subunit SecA